MAIVMLALDLYFAALLGVSGIAKLEHPERFAATLRRHRLFPLWSVGGISRFFPWAEITVASALITGFAPVLTSSIVLIFFISFFIVDGMLLATKRADECGCYGMAYTQKVDPGSVTTSGLLLNVAALHLRAIASKSAPPYIRRQEAHPTGESHSLLVLRGLEPGKQPFRGANQRGRGTKRR